MTDIANACACIGTDCAQRGCAAARMKPMTEAEQKALQDALRRALCRSVTFVDQPAASQQEQGERHAPTA